MALSASSAWASSGIIINGLPVAPPEDRPDESVVIRISVPEGNHFPGQQPQTSGQGLETYRWDSRQMRWRLECPGGEEQSLRCDVREIRNRLRERDR